MRYIMKARYKYIRGRKKSQPDLIELEIYFSRDSRLYLSTKTHIPEKFWDATRQVVLGKYTNAIEINNALSAYRSRIEKAEYEAISANREFTKEDAKAAAEGKPKERLNIKDTFTRYLIEDTRVMRINYKTFENHSSFLKAAYTYFNMVGIIYVDQLTEDCIKQYYEHLLANYSLSSCNTYINSLKKMCTRLQREHLLHENLFENLSKKRVTLSSRDGLTEDEVKTLETLAEDPDLPDGLRLCLDKFLFSCYTGLRISDNNAISKAAVEQRTEGLFLNYKTLKTGAILHLPLWNLFEGKPQRILQRYLDTYPTIDTIFPQCKRIRESLISIEQMCKLHTHLTFHIARHTCASLLARKTGNPFVIMNVLTHSDIKMSMKYIHNTGDALSSELDKVKW